jgi:hypothetical protein
MLRAQKVWEMKTQGELHDMEVLRWDCTLAVAPNSIVHGYCIATGLHFGRTCVALIAICFIPEGPMSMLLAQECLDDTRIIVYFSFSNSSSTMTTRLGLDSACGICMPLATRHEIRRRQALETHEICGCRRDHSRWSSFCAARPSNTTH